MKFEYLKMLKGESYTSTLVFKYGSYRCIINCQKNYIEEFQVRLNYGVSLPDYIYRLTHQQQTIKTCTSTIIEYLYNNLKYVLQYRHTVVYGYSKQAKTTQVWDFLLKVMKCFMNMICA